MEYYFTVIIDHEIFGRELLVKARDVLEAGKKVEDMLSREGMDNWGIEIVEITRTNITKVIE